MPAKVKKKTAKKKVTVATEAPKVDEDPRAEEKTEVVSPKIASFSQLDAKPVAEVAEERSKEKFTTEEVSEPTPPHEADIPPQQAPMTTMTEEKSAGSEVPLPDEKNSDDIKEWLKDIRPDTTKEVEKKGSFSFKVFFFLLFIFAVIGALVGGIFYYKDSMQKPSEEQLKTSEEKVAGEPTVEPTKPQVEVVDLKTFKLSVLNGSGVSGEAGRVKTTLSNAGFEAGNITAGNADKSNYEKTMISYKEEVSKQAIEAVKKALEETYTVEEDSEKLAESSTNDIVVTVGEKK